VELSAENFIRLRNLIYERTGISLGENKVYYVKKRLEKRMEAGGFASVEDYIRHLRFFDRGGREFQEFVNLLTVNETYFFRDFPQLQVFAEVCLEEVAERKREEKNLSLRLFSAGCSTGEEPYTLAIIVREMLDDYPDWKVYIKAVDIDENVLQRAQRGLYNQRSVKDVPPSYLAKYFVRRPGELYEVKPEIKEMVTFEHLNLIDKHALRNERGYDFVFCRNVLIYFDDLARKQVAEKFYAMLNRGGFVFLGATESLSRMSSAFKIRRMGGHVVYQR